MENMHTVQLSSSWILCTVATITPHVAPQGVQEVSDTLIQVREETPQETHQGVNMEVETTHATEICTI